MRVMMQKTVFIVFLDGFHFSAGWSSSPARCCSACGNTRSWGRSTGSQVKFLWEIHPGVKILTWILSRVEGGGLCDENRCCSKCSAELSDASQLNSQQADGKPGRNEVGWKQKKRVKDDTNSIKVELVIMVPPLQVRGPHPGPRRPTTAKQLPRNQRSRGLLGRNANHY